MAVELLLTTRESLGSWRSDVAAAAHRHKPDDWDKSAAVSLRCELFSLAQSLISALAATLQQIKIILRRSITPKPRLDKLSGQWQIPSVMQSPRSCSKTTQIVSLHATKEVCKQMTSSVPSSPSQLLIEAGCSFTKLSRQSKRQRMRSTATGC